MEAYRPFCKPRNEFERRLEMHDISTIAEKISFPDPPKKCDLCGTTFKNKRLMIDACIDKNINAWGCVCAECFYKYDLEIGWGKGQLYTHLKSGEWLMTAGNRPPDH